jgi:glycosyltransferase involved in cell wall biosynthesis
VLLPSLYEGFGFPVLEAMACAAPVVCSNASSLPEVAGGAALLVPPTDAQALADAVALLLTQPALAAELRRRGVAAGRALPLGECGHRDCRALSQRGARQLTGAVRAPVRDRLQ